MLLMNQPAPRAARGVSAAGYFVWLLLTISSTLHAEEIRGQVVGVHDGDTVTVLDTGKRQHKIRLEGIDAPELSQPYGHQSKKSLSDTVMGKSVVVETTKRDRYGREVGTIITPEGLNANLEQVRRGEAWHYKKYEREQKPSDRQAFADAEVNAKVLRRGLWQDANPQPPWDYRREKKGGQ